MRATIAWFRTDPSTNGSPAIARYTDSVLEPLRAVLPIEVHELGLRGKLATWGRWITGLAGPLGPVGRRDVGSLDAAVVVADHINASGGALRALRRYKQAHLVYLAHNDESDNRRKVARGFTGVRGLAYGFDARVAKRFEAKLLRRASLVIALTPNDAAALRPRTDAEVIVVPAFASPATAGGPPPARAVGVTGSTAWSVKRRGQEELLAALAPLISDGIRVVVFGSHNPDWVAEMQRKHPGVEFAGWVPSLAEGLKTVSVIALHEPLGGGFQLRLLDALAARRPVVGTTESLRNLRNAAEYSLAASDLGGVRELSARVVNDSHLRLSATADLVEQLTWLDDRDAALQTVVGRLHLLLAEPRDGVSQRVAQRNRRDVGK